MRARGQEFLSIPDSYYDQLREKLKSAKIKVTQDLNTVSSPAHCVDDYIYICNSCKTLIGMHEMHGRMHLN